MDEATHIIQINSIDSSSKNIISGRNVEDCEIEKDYSMLLGPTTGSRKVSNNEDEKYILLLFDCVVSIFSFDS